MADSKEKLFSDFAPTTTEQWMDKVTADLKGADFEKKLVWKTNEGFKVKPFYRMEDLEGLKTTDALPGEFPYLRGTKKDNNEWLVRQEIKVECPKEANTKALDILNKGVDSLVSVFHFCQTRICVIIRTEHFFFYPVYRKTILCFCHFSDSQCSVISSCPSRIRHDHSVFAACSVFIII